MRELKKFSFGNVSDTISDSQLKRVIGGYNDLNCPDGQEPHLCQCFCGIGIWDICATSAEDAEEKSAKQGWCDDCYHCS